MLRIRWRFLLPLFTSLMFSTLIHAQDEIAEDSKVIYLRENSCWGIYTYLDVLDSQKNKTGYYQNALSSFNSDIYLYDQSKNLVLSTDIKSFGKVRKQIYIHDSNKKVIARVEQEIFNKVGNDFVKKVLDLSSSPYRR
ncbi:MAG: hypothetical protein KA436_10920, partial [Oligoflexales bacterium]|nr:hypothetical protein [Oligoflexales bacterium]